MILATRFIALRTLVMQAHDVSTAADLAIKGYLRAFEDLIAALKHAQHEGNADELLEAFADTEDEIVTMRLAIPSIVSAITAAKDRPIESGQPGSD